MDTLINLYVTLTGAWKKVAAFLPLIGGIGSLLLGVGGFAIEISHAANAGALLDIIKGWNTDPNTALVSAGLLALGVHTNHKGNQTAIATNTQQIQSK